MRVHLRWKRALRAVAVTVLAGAAMLGGPAVQAQTKLRIGKAQAQNFAFPRFSRALFPLLG